MWAASNLSPFTPRCPLISELTRLPIFSPLSFTIAANSKPLGDTPFKVAYSENKAKNSTPKEEKRYKEEDGEEERQVSGSSVLWAMQRAAAQKKKVSGMKKNKEKRGASPSLVPLGSDKEEEVGVDYNKVRPLCIKSDWGLRLDELDKHLKELSETI